MCAQKRDFGEERVQAPICWNGRIETPPEHVNASCSSDQAMHEMPSSLPRSQALPILCRSCARWVCGSFLRAAHPCSNHSCPLRRSKAPCPRARPCGAHIKCSVSLAVTKNGARVYDLPACSQYCGVHDGGLEDSTQFAVAARGWLAATSVSCRPAARALVMPLCGARARSRTTTRGRRTLAAAGGSGRNKARSFLRG